MCFFIILCRVITKAEKHISFPNEPIILNIEYDWYLFYVKFIHEVYSCTQKNTKHEISKASEVKQLTYLYKKKCIFFSTLLMFCMTDLN